MRFRTTALISMLVLVLGIGTLTLAAVALIIDRAARQDVVEGLTRSRRVFEEQQAYRQSLFRAQCRMLAEEPRLKATVATEDVTPETVLDVARDLQRALKADLLLITNLRGQVLADTADPQAAGRDLSTNPLLQLALAEEESSGIWLSGLHAYQMQARQLKFGTTPVGVVVTGHLQDDRVAQSVYEQTASSVVIALDGQVIAASGLESVSVEDLAPVPSSEEQSLAVPAGEGEHPIAYTRLSEALAPVLSSTQPVEVMLAGRTFLATSAPFPGYAGSASLRYVVLRSLDHALAPSRRLTKAMALLLALAGTGAGMLAAAMSRRLSRPLDALVAFVGRIAKGDRTAPSNVMQGPLEVRQLGEAMNRMVQELEESRRQLSVKERLEREMEIASHLQTAILPHEMKVQGLEIAARMLPATEVGGDYYDVLPVGSGAFIGIGDVAGHGLTAGVVMLMIQNVTSTLVRTHPDASPRELVCRLNEVVFENVRKRLRRNEHATFSLLRYHLDGRVTYAGAHEEIVICRAATGRCERLPVQGTWIGAMKSVERFTTDVPFQLEPGDLMVLYTDGVTEAMNAHGEQFGIDRLCAEVERRRLGATEQICEGVFEAVKSWSVEQADDITVLVMRYRGPAVVQP